MSVSDLNTALNTIQTGMAKSQSTSQAIGSDLSLDGLEKIVATSTGLDLNSVKSQITNVASDPVGQISNVMTAIFTQVEKGADMYLYYISVKNLNSWLQARVSLVQKIYTDLNFLYQTSPILVATESIDPIMSKFISYLKTAQSYLLQVPMLTVGTLVTAFNNISTIKQAQNSLHSYGSDRVGFWLLKAYNEIELARTYVQTVGILDTKKFVTNLDKQLFQQIKTQTNNIMTALGNLALEIPVLAGVALSATASIVQGTSINQVTNMLKATATQLVSDTLSSLNQKIDSAIVTVNNFNASTNNFVSKVQNINLLAPAGLRDAALDNFITDVSTVDYPTSLLDFLLKSTVWDVSLKAVEGTLATSFLAGNALLLSQDAQTALSYFNSSYTQQLQSGKYADLLCSELLKRFAGLAGFMAYSNVNALRQLKNESSYLMKLANASMSADLQMIQTLSTFKEPPGYQLFEAGFDSVCNILQKNPILSADADKLVSALRDGSFLNIIGDVKSAWSTIVDQFNAAKSPFDTDPLFKDKNLLTSNVTPDTTAIVKSSYSGFKEVLDSIKTYLGKL